MVDVFWMKNQISCGSRTPQITDTWTLTGAPEAHPEEGFWPTKLGSGTQERHGWVQCVNQAVELLSHQSGREIKRNNAGSVMHDTILSFLKVLPAFKRKAIF